MSMYECMKDLINNKYYKDKKDIIDRLNVFLAYGMLIIEQYKELMDLTEQKYGTEN